MKKLKITMLMMALAAAGCQKEDQTKPGKMEGSFRGYLYLSSKDNTVLYPDSIHISFTGMNYKSTTYANKLNQFDTGSIDGGTYTIKGDSLLAEEQLMHPGTAAGIPGYGFYFGGHFKSEIKSDSLILTRQDQNGLLYTYRLVKQ